MTINSQAGMGVGLGWTLPETIQEYGQLVGGPEAAGIGKTQYDFVAQGYKIRAFYLHDHIGGIAYEQPTSFSGRLLRAFFLSEDSPEATWDEPVTQDGGALTWIGKVDGQVAYLAAVSIPQPV